MAAQNPASRDVPAVIAGSVNLLGFSAALARAGDPALNRPLNP
jgi:hypothetical protein